MPHSPAPPCHLCRALSRPSVRAPPPQGTRKTRKGDTAAQTQDPAAPAHCLDTCVPRVSLSPDPGAELVWSPPPQRSRRAVCAECEAVAAAVSRACVTAYGCAGPMDALRSAGTLRFASGEVLAAATQAVAQVTLGSNPGPAPSASPRALRSSPSPLRSLPAPSPTVALRSLPSPLRSLLASIPTAALRSLPSPLRSLPCRWAHSWLRAPLPHCAPCALATVLSLGFDGSPPSQAPRTPRSSAPPLPPLI